MFASFCIISCNRTSINDKINKVGDIAGEAAGSFAKGVGNGATKAFDVDVALKPSLLANGIKRGKATVSSDSIGVDNLLSVYLIFEKDFSNIATAKIFDAKNQEMGRVIQLIEAKANETKFVDFHFSQRTNIDSDCKITIE